MKIEPVFQRTQLNSPTGVYRYDSIGVSKWQLPFGSRSNDCLLLALLRSEDELVRRLLHVNAMEFGCDDDVVIVSVVSLRRLVLPGGSIK